MHNNLYEIEGVLETGKDKEGNDMVYIKAINVNKLDKEKEEQHIYPCYYYDNGLCEEINKYNLEY